MICTGAPPGPLTPVVRSETSCLRGLSAWLSFESSVGFTIAAGADRIKTELKLDAWTPPPLFLCHARHAGSCPLPRALSARAPSGFRFRFPHTATAPPGRAAVYRGAGGTVTSETS